MTHTKKVRRDYFMRPTMTLMLLAMPLLCGCGVIKPGWVNENYFDTPDSKITKDDFDGPLGGHFDKEGNWVPDKPEIAMTYKLPDISSGAIYDIPARKVSPAIQIELFEIDTHVPYLRTLKLDAGVAYQRGYLYVGKLLTNIFEVSIGAWCGWNFEDRKLAYGVGLTIIRF